ncbi:ISL3 family transposase [Brachybacterium sp. JHP9]|uniref:ISL3 family transposase n=1 Tax=Brachybacterium equifaecis TaxID=2910770 RepID=A0ABT0QXQ5_9MICO|nr:ISL3 family transposase [Brachybacterium equifaecis]MCL6421928.1 ISL3 family transposase [Brachybacterium equifaecis]
MPHATFNCPDLTTFAALDGLGLVCTGQLLEQGGAVLECRLTDTDPWCRACGARASSRGTIARRLAHVPFGHRPTMLLLRIRRYRCQHCGRRWREDTRGVAEPRAKLTRTALAWVLAGLVIDHLSVSRIAAGLGVAWHTANTAVLAEGKRLLIGDPSRFEGVSAIGVDEHVWRHTRRGDRYVTVIVDLTANRAGTGPARLLDMIEGRSKEVFKSWLGARPAAWRDGIEIVAMDGFTGFKTAAAEVLPGAVAVMDPFHVVQLAGDGLDRCRQRIQQATCGHRGRAGDPLFQARRVLHTGVNLLTAKQDARITGLFADDRHAAVEIVWDFYQKIVASYRQSDPGRGRHMMREVIEKLAHQVPAELPELARLGRTLHRRREDILAYFENPRTSNGPTEAINGRLEHLRGSALGFRNLTHYITRSLLETGGFRPRLHPQMR